LKAFITWPFYLGVHEVTVGQFRQFVAGTHYQTEAEKNSRGGAGYVAAEGKIALRPEFNWQNPGFPQSSEHPVLNVSWNDAAAFCDWLTRKEGQTYRLPTEAEWEYACRAGTTTRYYSGDDPESLAGVGNVADAAAKTKFSDWKWTIAASDGSPFTAPVGRYGPNAFGLYDMHGSVWEWCSDWYAKDYYAASPADDPRGPAQGTLHVLRGGSWLAKPSSARASSRFHYTPLIRVDFTGFRVVRAN
jgi:formylglycine-generating enzyme required for sulfatase activity